MNEMDWADAQSLPPFDFNERYSWDSYPGTAFYASRWETVPDDDTEWTGIERATGRVLVVMVGDDREHSVDPDDLIPLADGAYCPECGQVGCTAYPWGMEDE